MPQRRHHPTPTETRDNHFTNKGLTTNSTIIVQANETSVPNGPKVGQADQFWRQHHILFSLGLFSGRHRIITAIRIAFLYRCKLLPAGCIPLYRLICRPRRRSDRRVGIHGLFLHQEDVGFQPLDDLQAAIRALTWSGLSPEATPDTTAAKLRASFSLNRRKAKTTPIVYGNPRKILLA